jgi:tetratricopeptide (TPR) repeat protein
MKAPGIILRLVLSVVILHGLFSCVPKHIPGDHIPIPVPDYVKTITNPAKGFESGLDDLYVEVFNRAWAKFQQGKIEEATKVFENIAELDIKFFPALVALAYIEMLDEDYGAARRMLGKSLTIKRDYLPALLGLGVLYRIMNEPLKAFSIYGVILDKYPGQADARIQYDLIRLRQTERYLLLGRKYRQEGDYKPALENYKKAMNFVLQEDFIYAEVGFFLLEYKKYKEAVPYLQNAANLKPQYANYLKALAFALENVGKLSQARTYYKKVLEVNPMDKTVRNDIERVTRSFKRIRTGIKTKSIEASRKVTRGQAAVYLAGNYPFLGDPPPRETIVITDIIGNPNALRIINLVKRDIFDIYSNHTFAPKRYLSRVDLAILLGRLIKHSLPASSIRMNTAGTQIEIADVPLYSPSYKVIKRVIALGLMSLDRTGKFHSSRFINGKDFILATDKLVNMVQ